MADNSALTVKDVADLLSVDSKNRLQAGAEV